MAPTKTLLIVDDDPDILESLSEVLEAEGFSIRKARNGREALEQLKLERPAAILLDLMMPVMDGWEFAQAVKGTPEATVPIIILSADRNVAGRAKEMEAFGYLAKPFELEELLSLVARATG